jgi:hypothetical protein
VIEHIPHLRIVRLVQFTAGILPRCRHVWLILVKPHLKWPVVTT